MATNRILIALSSATIFFCSCHQRTPETFDHNGKRFDQVTAGLTQIRRNPDVIYHSTNNGVSWSSFANGIPPDATVSGFTTHANEVFAATDAHGVFVSTNGLNKWTSLQKGLPDKPDINAIAAVENSLVIGTFGEGIFISTDHGNQWQPSQSDLKNIPVRCLISHSNKLFAGTDKGVYESNDRGKSWKHLYGNLQINGFTSLHGNLYAAAVNGALISRDKGESWNYIYDKHTLHDISDDGNYLYAMTLGDGLLKNDNGQTWVYANPGSGQHHLYTFEVKGIGNDLFAAQWFGIFHSVNAGNNWTITENGLPDSTAFTTLEITDFGILAGTGLRKKLQQ